MAKALAAVVELALFSSGRVVEVFVRQILIANDEYINQSVSPLNFTLTYHPIDSLIRPFTLMQPLTRGRSRSDIIKTR